MRFEQFNIRENFYLYIYIEVKIYIFVVLSYFSKIKFLVYDIVIRVVVNFYVFFR